MKNYDEATCVKELNKKASCEIDTIIQAITKIHDENDTYFVFDITTETVIKIPDEISEMSEELMQELIPLAQQRSYAAIRDMSLAMGINELDLSK